VAHTLRLFGHRKVHGCSAASSADRRRDRKCKRFQAEVGHKGKSEENKNRDPDRRRSEVFGGRFASTFGICSLSSGSLDVKDFPLSYVTFICTLIRVSCNVNDSTSRYAGAIIRARSRARLIPSGKPRGRAPRFLYPAVSQHATRLICFKAER